MFKSDDGRFYPTELEALKADTNFWKEKCLELQKRGNRRIDKIFDPQPIERELVCQTS